jgi:hypothetical protein
MLTNIRTCIYAHPCLLVSIPQADRRRHRRDTEEREDAAQREAERGQQQHNEKTKGQIASVRAGQLRLETDVAVLRAEGNETRGRVAHVEEAVGTMGRILETLSGVGDAVAALTSQVVAQHQQVGGGRAGRLDWTWLTSGWGAD